MWIPAHKEIEGNEKVDRLAKQALEVEDIINISLSKSEGKAIIKAYTIREWQQEWDTGNTGRQLYEIQKEVTAVRITKRGTKEETILTRLRLGHTMLNKTLKLINKHPTGKCDHCGLEETVEHVICVCQNIIMNEK